jgi:hypothetical protein
MLLRLAQKPSDVPGALAREDRRRYSTKLSQM